MKASIKIDGNARSIESIGYSSKRTEGRNSSTIIEFDMCDYMDRNDVIIGIDVTLSHMDKIFLSISFGSEACIFREDGDVMFAEDATTTISSVVRIYKHREGKIYKVAFTANTYELGRTLQAIEDDRQKYVYL